MTDESALCLRTLALSVACTPSPLRSSLPYIPATPWYQAEDMRALEFSIRPAAMRTLVAALLVATAAVQAVAAAPVWRTFVGTSFGDVTADEWARTKRLSAPKSIPEAIELLRPYVGGDPWAATIYAALLMESTDEQSAEALAVLRVAAAAGNPHAQLRLSVRLPETDPEAGRLLRSAAELGHPRACTYLAEDLSAHDPEAAKAKLTTCAAAGDELAYFALAGMVDGNSFAGRLSTRTIELLRSAARTPGLYSTTALRRVTRKGNDVPGAVYRLAVELSEVNTLGQQKEAEGLFIDMTGRVLARDKAVYKGIGYSLASMSSVQLLELYSRPPLLDAKKAQEQLRLAQLGDPDTLYRLALTFSPVGGKVPDGPRYIQALEAAAAAGLPTAAQSLSFELRSGRFLAANPARAIEVLRPHAKTDDESVLEEYGHSLLNGTKEERIEGVRRLYELWEKSRKPRIALALGGYFGDQNAADTYSVAQTWFGRAIDWARESSGKSNSKADREVAEAALLGAVGSTLGQGDLPATSRWLTRAHGINAATDKVIRDMEAFLAYSTAASSADRLSALRLIRSAAADGSGTANMMLGLVFLLDPDASLQREGYWVYFVRAYEANGPAVASAVLDVLLKHLPAANAEHVKAWLKLTARDHTPHMRAIDTYLSYRDSSSDQSRRYFLDALRNQARVGIPFSQGVIGYLAYSGDASIGVTRKEALDMMWASVQSPSPFSHSFAGLGAAFVRGQEVRQDVDAGLTLLKRGAEFGSGAAMYEIARLHLDGESVPANSDEARRWAFLSQRYLEPRADQLLKEIDARDLAKRRQPVLVTAPKSPPAAVPVETAGGGFFKGLATFLGELLVVGVVVGLAVLAGPAVLAVFVPSDPGMASPASQYMPQAVQAMPRTPYTPPTALRPIGLPSYSNSGTSYVAAATLPPAVLRAPDSSWRVQSGLANSTPVGTSPRARSIEIADGTYDPARTLRGQIQGDGSFTGRNLIGGEVRGYIRSSGNRTDIEVRPGYGLNPTDVYRGSVVGSQGNLHLRNPYTGAEINGRYSTGGGYSVR